MDHDDMSHGTREKKERAAFEHMEKIQKTKRDENIHKERKQKNPGTGESRSQGEYVMSDKSETMDTANSSARKTEKFKGEHPPKIINFDNELLKKPWDLIIDRQREELETDVLAITRPRSNLDPIAMQALESLKLHFVASVTDDSEDEDFSEKVSLKGILKTLKLKSAEIDRLKRQVTETMEEIIEKYDGKSKQVPSALVKPLALCMNDFEKLIRTYIGKLGIASEIKKVTSRLNAQRMTNGCRWVLSATYLILIAKLISDNPGEIKELIKDDLGVAEKIMLDLEAKGGHLDEFAAIIVQSVMERNRITESPILQKLVSQQVRRAI